MKIVTEINEKQKKNEMGIEGLVSCEEIDANIVKYIANFARAAISPVCSFWGGLVA